MQPAPTGTTRAQLASPHTRNATLLCALCAQLSLDAELQDCESRLRAAAGGLARTAYPLLVDAREALGYRMESTTRTVSNAPPDGGTQEVVDHRLVRDASDDATAHALLMQLDQLAQRCEDAPLLAILDRTDILYRRGLPVTDKWLVSLAAVLCWYVAKCGGSIVGQEARLAGLRQLTGLPRETVDAVWRWRCNVMADADFSLNARARTLLLMDDVAEATEATSGGARTWRPFKRRRVSVTVGPDERFLVGGLRR